MEYLKEYRKALVAVATVLGTALALGLVPEDYKVYATLVINVLGAYGVYRLPNDSKPSPQTERWV